MCPLDAACEWSMGRGWPAVFTQWFVNDFYPPLFQGLRVYRSGPLNAVAVRGAWTEVNQLFLCSGL